MKLNIVEFIQFIRKRPNMVFYKANENLSLNYINFFEGILYGLEYNHSIDLERELSKWYQEKVKFKAPNMVWFAQFEHINKDLPEQEKIDKLLNTLEEFFIDFNLEDALDKN